MLTTVRGNKLKSAVEALLYNKSVNVNILITGGDKKVMVLQTDNGFIDDYIIEDIKSDGITDPEGISLEIDRTLLLLDGALDVTLDISSTYVEIQQLGFKCIYQTTSVPRVELSSNANLTYRPFSVSTLANYSRQSKSLDLVAKSLAQLDIPTHFSNGESYLQYSTAIFKTSVEMPNCRLAGETITRLVRALSRAKSCAIAEDVENGLIFFKLDNGEKLIVPVMQADTENVYTVNQLLENVKWVTDLSVKQYAEAISLITQVNTATLVDVGVCPNGLRVSVSSAKTQYNVGSMEPAIFTIRISTMQLLAIAKIFGEDPKVSVGCGGNTICLQSVNKTLLLSGLVY